VPADAASGQHWSLNAAQARQATGAHPAYGSGQPGPTGQSAAAVEQPGYQQPGYQQPASQQPASQQPVYQQQTAYQQPPVYQQQPAYQGEQQPAYQVGTGAQLAGTGTGAMTAFPAATGSQPTAFPATDGNGYAPHGQAPNGQAATGYAPNGYAANGHDPSNGFRPAPAAPQPGGTPSFTPTFTPNGAANSAGAQGEPRQSGQPGQNPAGNGQPTGAYPAAPGYQNGQNGQNGAAYPAAGPQPSWPEGQAAAQGPGLGYPAGPGQTSPLAAEHPSSPGYAPAGQFDPSQQSYWE
jgi:hypothetical protein